MTEDKRAVHEYMEKLPEYIRENIMQSGVEIESVEQLEKIANGMREER